MTGFATFLPSYDPSPEYNAQILRQSVPLMMKHQVSTQPINYAVWYEYVAGNNTKLNEEVNQLLQNRSEIDDATNLELYKNHICNASIEMFEEINGALQALISKTADSVQDSSFRVSSAGVNVNAGALKLDNIDNLDDVKDVLQGIVRETRKLLNISQTLKSQLSEANEELVALHVELSKVRELASTDALTGLLNRRAFDTLLADLVDSSSQSSYCLVILDLDHFKRVNDDFGHLVGDKVLRYTASLIKQSIAGHHHAARFGGEEMAVIMPDTKKEKAFDIAEKIRETLANNLLKQRDNDLSIGTVTVSIGITELHADDSIDDFVSRADRALYEAKKTGRNRVVWLGV